LKQHLPKIKNTGVAVAASFVTPTLTVFVALVALVAFVTNVAPIAATISAAEATDNAPTLLPLSKPPEVNDTAPVPPFPARVPETSAPPRAIA
jgi:hypothetical protein